MKITDNIKYIGVNDYKTDLFESLYRIPDGMSYNSYLILDEKIAVMDTVDEKFKEEWLNNIKTLLKGRRPDYLVIQHMEPDHSANIAAFMELYPDTVLVASAPSFTMIKQFFGLTFENRILAIEETTLCLGRHTLHFFAAPMVHWPEVILTYDDYDKVLFSADAFGKFGALDKKGDWISEARRYYFGIIGKYGVQVQNLLKKLTNIDIKVICPLHGPILDDHLDYYFDLYHTWSSYKPETAGVFIAYTSVYGNTKKACELLAEKLYGLGCPKVILSDLSRSDLSECVEAAFRYSTLVLASTTYNSAIFPTMHDFLSQLREKNYQNRNVALIENGTWMPAAIKTMKSMLADCQNLTFAENEVHIRSALNDDSLLALDALATELRHL